MGLISWILLIGMILLIFFFVIKPVQTSIQIHYTQQCDSECGKGQWISEWASQEGLSANYVCRCINETER